MKTKSVIFTILLTPFFSPLAFATCSYGTNNTAKTYYSGSFSVGTVYTQRDAPVGTILATAVDPGTTTPIAGCSSAYTYNGFMKRFTTLSSYGNAVYDTGIDGVGIKIAISGRSGGPFQESVSANEYKNYVESKLYLVKTASGATGAGTIVSGQVFQANVYEVAGTNTIASVFRLTDTATIVPVACSVTQSTINVAMGDVKKNTFTGPGSTSAAQSFSIPLNCDSNTKINLTLDAGSAGSYDSSNGILNLDSSDSESASGVGLQILYNSSPVALGTAFSIGTATSDGVYTIPMTARYYQTASSVTAGAANASATFTMTYK